MAKETLYWQSKHPLGSGKGAINQGEEIRNYSDPRLAAWKENGTVSNKQVITFAEKKNDELDAAKSEIQKLNLEIAVLKDKQSGKKKIATLEDEKSKLEEANQTLTDTVTNLTADLDKATA